MFRYVRRECNTIMRTLYKIVTNIVLAVVLLFAGVLFLPRIFGLQPLAVLSGSMEPTYHVGSLIYVKDVKPSSIQVGEPMTYRVNDNTMVTHRVVGKDEQAQTFQTKGDANNNQDGGEVSYGNVVGKPIFSIPLLGYAAVYAATKSGTIVLITAILVILILTFLPDLLMGKEEKKTEVQDGANKK